MKFIAFVGALIAASLGFKVNAQESPSIINLKQQIEDRSFNQEKFWNEIQSIGTPLIESTNPKRNQYWVTFLYRAGEDDQLKNVIVATELNNNDPKKNQMRKIPGTNIWYKCYQVDGRSKFTYSIGTNDPLTPFWKSADMSRFGHLIPDPFNPKVLDFVFYKVSIAELPLAVKLSTNDTSSLPTHQRIISSTFLKRDKIVDFIQFGDGDPNRKYELVILLDGNVYANFREMIGYIQSQWSLKKIRPLIIAFVHSSYPDRQEELSCNTNFISFLADELISSLSDYNIDKENITIAGSSMGGLTATFAAYKRSDVFRNVIAQSSSFQWKPEDEKTHGWIVTKLKNSKKLPINFLLSTGLFETQRRDHVSQLEINRKMHKVLRDKGYNVAYFEYHGGHDYLHWQYFLIEGIKLFNQK